MPFALLTAQISAVALARDPFYGAAAAIGMCLALLAILGSRLDRRARSWAPASVPYYFLSMNLALALGFVAFARGTQSIAWTPTPRLVPPDAEGAR